MLCLFTYKTYAIKDGFSDMNFCIRVNQRQLNLPKTYEKVSSYMLLNQNFLTENSELWSLRILGIVQRNSFKIKVKWILGY